MEISIWNNGNLSSCEYNGNSITLGYEFAYAETVLSDNDFDIFISDSISHEVLHGILLKEFSLTDSKLFDVIEHLICDIDIKEKVFKRIRVEEGDDIPITWHDYITTVGFNVFLQEYNIDNIDLIQSYILTRGV